MFCSVLSNGPMLKSDAIVVLAGEDAEARAAVGAELFRQRAAPVLVLSGGKDGPPRWLSASSLAPIVMGHGIAHDRIRVEADSQNTREQAVANVAMAKVEGWRRLLLVASPYHAPRAFLSFVKALDEAEALDTIQVVNAPAAQVAWGKCPPGMDATRLKLLREEFDKIEKYDTHVASYKQGLDYLAFWEGK
jgi:uncharacterized SAM-binding protein YcdF (DUF218 family)